jgi:hypothetical protein
MDKTSVWYLAIVGILYLWIGQYTAAAKCSGAWAIHACHGGNGKRSDGGSLADNSRDNSQRRISLQRIIAGDFDDRQPWQRATYQAEERPDTQESQELNYDVTQEDTPQENRLRIGRELLEKLMLLLKLKSEMRR